VSNSKKALFYESILRDWAFWIGIGFGFYSSISNLNPNYFGSDAQLTPTSSGAYDFTASIIDGTVSMGIGFAVVSVPLALIRRRIGSDKLVDNLEINRLDNYKRTLSAFVVFLLAAIGSVVAATGQDHNVTDYDSDAALLAIIEDYDPTGGATRQMADDETRVSECRPQGEDELCAEVSLIAESQIQIDFRLSYAEVKIMAEKKIVASTWTVVLNCLDNSLQVLDVRLLDETGNPILMTEDDKRSLADGMATDYSALVNNCP
jgi:hypothetical protein